MPPTVTRRKQAGSGRGRGGHVLFQKCSLTAVASAIAAETLLGALVVEAKTLYRNRQGLRVTIRGTTAANGNNKQMKLYVNTTGVLAAATAVYDSGTVTINAKGWGIDCLLFRTASNVQLAYAKGYSDATLIAMQRTALTLTDTSDFYFVIGGTAATGAADITTEFFMVESFNDVP